MPDVRISRSRVVAVVAALAIVATGPSASAKTPTRRTVVLIGDSVMAGLNPRYTDAARKVIGSAGWNVVIDAAVNRTTAQGAAVAQARRTQLTDTVVIMLGHNDGATPSLFRARAQQVMRVLAKAPRVYWLTMREPRYAAANKIMRGLMGTYRNLRLIEWAGAVRSGWTARDGLHLNGTGATAMARLILGTIW